jgi:hypothetical protein
MTSGFSVANEAGTQADDGRAVRRGIIYLSMAKRRRALDPAETALRRLRRPVRVTKRVAPATAHRPALAIYTTAHIRRQLRVVEKAYRDAVDTVVDETAQSDAPIKALPDSLTLQKLYEWWAALGPRQREKELAQMFPALESLARLRDAYGELNARLVGRDSSVLAPHDMLNLLADAFMLFGPVLPLLSGTIRGQQQRRERARRRQRKTTAAVRNWMASERDRMPLLSDTIRGQSRELAARFLDTPPTSRLPILQARLVEKHLDRPERREAATKDLADYLYSILQRPRKTLTRQ